MQRGGTEDATDGDTSVSRDDVEFGSNPGFLEARASTFAPLSQAFGKSSSICPSVMSLAAWRSSRVLAFGRRWHLRGCQLCCFFPCPRPINWRISRGPAPLASPPPRAARVQTGWKSTCHRQPGGHYGARAHQERNRGMAGRVQDGHPLFRALKKTRRVGRTMPIPSRWPVRWITLWWRLSGERKPRNSSLLT